MTGDDHARMPIFRFIQFGRPAAGKSCWAAALAMPRLPHAPNAESDGEAPPTVTYIENPPAALLERIERRWPRDPKLEPMDRAPALQAGARWVEGARTAIFSGKALEPTPTDVLYPMLFQVTTGKQNFLMLLMDYSGEIWAQGALKTLDSDAAPGQIAHKVIMRAAREGDGVVILADRPQSGAPLGLAATELMALAGAFHEMADGTRLPPIVVAINKWDRAYAMDERGGTLRRSWNVEREEEALRGYLASGEGAFHRQLETEMKRVVGAEGFKVFPVSALGPCRRTTGGSQDKKNEVIETPLIAHERVLNAFNVAEPFAWMAGQAAARAARRAEDRTRGAGLLSSKREIEEVLREASAQTSGNAEQHERVRAADESYRRRWRKQAAAASLVGASLLVVAPPGVNSSLQLESLRAFDADCARSMHLAASCPSEELEDHRSSLAGIASGSRYLNMFTHLALMSPPEAEGFRLAADRELEIRAATDEAAETAGDLRAAVLEAQSLLAQPPSELRADEIEPLVGDLRSALAQRPDEKIPPDRAGFGALTQELAGERAAAEKILPALEELRAAVVLADAQRRFQEALRDGRFAEALDALSQLPPDPEGADQERMRQVLGQIERSVERMLADSRSERASEGRADLERRAVVVLDEITAHPNLHRLGEAGRRRLHEVDSGARTELQLLTQSARYAELREIWPRWTPGNAETARLDALFGFGDAAFPPQARDVVSAARNRFERNRRTATFVLTLASIRSIRWDCSGVDYIHRVDFGGVSLLASRAEIRMNASLPVNRSVNIDLAAGTSYDLRITADRDESIWSFSAQCADSDSLNTTVNVQDLVGGRNFDTRDGNYRYAFSIRLAEPLPVLPDLGTSAQ